MSAKPQNNEMLEFLAHARKISKEIETWPDWKKGPIGVNLYPDNIRRAETKNKEVQEKQGD
ncbi:MAG: hypothetical protein GX444_02000 [Myxococcales bacterium]|nr:hypothetical protein [Myxococcales bacterium]